MNLFKLIYHLKQKFFSNEKVYNRSLKIKMNVQIAAQQPPTTAKVILYTSHGEIDIELWTKQAPLASKNFIQHCLQGYYLNTCFHRLIPGFMIQGGDPTGTGMGGQSIYNGPFKDQFHQRLKFTRRGIVAMANAGKNSNKSQFFITFGPCQHLNKKHTIFGKVVGDTVYNLMALQSLDTGQQDKPLDPPIIRRIKVVQNPFTDINIKAQQSNQIEKQSTQQLKSQSYTVERNQKQSTKKQQIKKLKNKKKLTFQDDEDAEQCPAPKLLSSHDVLYKKDASLSNRPSMTKQDIQRKRKEKQLQQKKAHQIKNTLSLNQNHQTLLDHHQDGGMNSMVSKQMQKKRIQFQKNITQLSGTAQKDEVLNYIRRYNPTTNKHEIVFQDQLERERVEKERQQELEKKARQQQEITDQKLRQVRQLQLHEYNLLKTEQLNFKKAKQGSLKERRKQIIEEEKKLLSNLEKHRYEYTKRQKMDKHQGQLFKKLIDFSSRLKTGKATSGKEQNVSTQVKQKEGVNLQAKGKMGGKNSWMNHKLKFHIDSTNAYSMQQKAMRINKPSFQEEDDGGLKMEIDYNNQENESNDNQIQQALKDL